MNSKIRNLNLESLLFFDAEFVRANEELEIDSREFGLYQKKLRDRETGDYPEAQVVQAHYKKNGGLDPVFNKVVCVTVGFIKGNTFFYKHLLGTQREILEQFYNTIVDTALIPCGHNSIGFDLPSLRIKAFQSNIDFSTIPEKFNDSQKKPWNMTDATHDTMEIIKGTYFYNISLDGLAYLAGFDSPKDDIDGSEVSDVYYAEGVERIAEYCGKDTLTVARIMCAFQNKRDLIQNVVERKKEVAEKLSVFKRILSAGTLTSDTKKELLEKSKGLNEEEKEHLVTLTKAPLGKKESEFTDDEQEFFNQLRK